MVEPRPDAPETVYGRLTLICSLGGLSQRSLSSTAGLSFTYLGAAFTRMRRDPEASIDTDAAMRLAKAVGVSLDWLIAGQGDPPTSESIAAAMKLAKERLDLGDGPSSLAPTG